MSTPSTNLIVSGTGAVYMQNLAVQGNSIIATNTDGSIQFVPNGNGVIGFGDVGFNNGVISTTITDLDIVLSPDGNGTVKTGNLQLTGNTISSTDTNGDLLLVPNGSGNVGIGTASPAEKLDVEGTLRHQGLTLNEGTTPNVDEVKTFNLTVSYNTTSWTDVGITRADLASGSYIIQLYVDNGSTSVANRETYYTGFMSWFGVDNISGDPPTYNEILLHHSGRHQWNGSVFYLRTYRDGTAGTMSLQIKNATRANNDVGMTFKFRRMI